MVISIIRESYLMTSVAINSEAYFDYWHLVNWYIHQNLYGALNFYDKIA